jgi:hypothetical protein
MPPCTSTQHNNIFFLKSPSKEVVKFALELAVEKVEHLSPTDVM